MTVVEGFGVADTEAKILFDSEHQGYASCPPNPPSAAVLSGVEKRGFTGKESGVNCDLAAYTGVSAVDRIILPAAALKRVSRCDAIIGFGCSKRGEGREENKAIESSLGPLFVEGDDTLGAILCDEFLVINKGCPGEHVQFRFGGNHQVLTVRWKGQQHEEHGKK
jgi:hypothetical protein